MDGNTESILQSIPLFRGLPAPLMAALAGQSRRRRCQRGEVILHAGDTTRAVGAVLSGAVRLEREDALGNRELVGQVHAGEIFAEVFAVLGDAPVQVTAVAAEAAEVLFLPVETLMAEPEAALRLLRLMAGKNAALSEKLRHISRRSTREKLLSYLDAERTRADSDRFTIRFDRQQLADYLAVDRSAMCRELSRMRAEGLLDYDRRDFYFPRGLSPV